MNKKNTLPGLLILLIFLVVLGYFVFQKLKISPDLEGFYILTKDDPLFYSPFLDGNEFKAALERLKEAEEQLKEISIENRLRNEDSVSNEGLLYKETLTKTNIFPYQFWETLILINQETDNFLESPSLEKADNLLAFYEIATDSYLQDISALIKVVESIEEEERRKPLLLIDSQTNLDIILADYRTIKKNAYALKEEINQRKECLGGRVNCLELKKEHSVDYFIQLLGQNSSPQPKELKPETELVRHFISTVFLEAKTSGPYKIESACWQSPDNSHWMYLIYEKREDVTFAISKLAEQNYYEKAKIPPRNRLAEAKMERGLNFWVVIETNHYRCTDLAFYPTLLTLDFLKREAKKKGVEPRQLVKGGQYEVLVKNQFGLLPPVINWIASIINVQKEQLMILEEYHQPFFYLYGFNPAYSIFYLPYAHSVWRLDEELQYLIPKEEEILILESEKRFYKLSGLKDMGYSKEEIEKFHINLRKFVESLFE